MERIRKKIKIGDLVYVDVLTVAQYDWEFAIQAGDILRLQDSVKSFPKIPCIVLSTRQTLKTAEIFIPNMGVKIRTSYKNIYEIGVKK